MTRARILVGDVRAVLPTLPDGCVQTCVTSPPYFGLRDYGVDGQIGLKQTPDAFVAELVSVFREVRRLLRDDGTLWLNLGDSYANPGHYNGNPGDGRNSHAQAEAASGFNHGKAWPGAKNKDLIGIPWRVAFALQADGWYLRQDIIWHKPNPMPESVRDRCTKAHEYLFLLSKQERYYFDADAIAEPLAESSVKRYELADSRVLEESDHYKDRVGVASGRPKHADGLVMRRSGNKERKPSSARGVPVDENSRGVSGAVAGSVPCEGSTRNKRSVWTVPTKPYAGAHFATFPPELITPCILAGSRPGDVVLDPFGGSGTTAAVAVSHGRSAVSVELNPEYVELQRQRIGPLLCDVEEPAA